MDASKLTPERKAYMQATFYDSKIWENYTVSIIGLVVAVATTMMRFLARRLQQAGLKSDDWLMALTLVCGT